MRKADKKTGRRTAALLTAVVLAGTAAAGSFPMTAFAIGPVGPGSSRSEEEWARLKDNVLEYEEIEGLIEEYNVSVRESYENWRKADSGKALEDYVSDAEQAVEDQYDQAAGAEDELTMITSEYQARMSEIQVQSTIDAAEDSTTKLWELENTAKSLASQAQSSMNTYYQLQSQLASAQKNRQLAAESLELAKRQQNSSVGMATYADVLTAQQNLQNLDAQILSLQNQIESTRQNLIVMLGWAQDAQPEMRPMPALDLNRIAAMDPAADLTAAYENDYTLKADQRKLDNSVTLSGQTVHGSAVENDKQQIAIALNSAYQSVLSAKAAYDQASLNLDVASRSCSSAQAKQRVGIGTAMETLQAEANLVSCQSDLEVKGLQLFDAMETYDWVKKGVR